MSFGDLSRINTNLQAMSSLHTLQKTNSALGERQMRLATGSRLNKAEDDSAGYAISKKLEARVRGQAQALSNVGDAKSMLTVAEGSLNTTMDILQTMKEKTIQAANDTMGTQERAAIQSQLTALASEISDTLGDSSFNGTSLFSAGAQTSFSFHVNAESGDTFVVTLATMGIGELGSGTMSIASLDVETDAASRSNSIAAIDAAINTVSDQMATIGDNQKRLSFKQENLTTSMNNYESARSRIADADFAKEQMEIVKLQILQQTGTAALSQANQAPQSILSLIG